MTIVNVDPLLAEELFQHIWQFRLFSRSGLTTLEGEPVSVDHPGQWNRHAGPDFTAARIRIGNTLWVGNVELHLKTSDWFRHGHQHDPLYRSVILHIVFEHDMNEGTTNGIPILELQPAVPKLLLQRYESLRQSAAFVPCSGQANDVSPLIWACWKDRLLVERLELKADMLKGWLLQTQYDWEEVCFRALARAAGMPVNGDAFLCLAQSLPYRVLARGQHDLFYLEALLFGQAGMLEDTATDAYMLGLQREYHYQRHKHRFTPLATGHWKWLRMRPASFPCMKIAFLAALMHKVPRLFSRILEATDAGSLERLLQVRPSDYWLTHYRFGKAVDRAQLPGTRAVHNMLINTILPLLYLYGREKGDDRCQEKAIAFMRQLPAEENHVLRGWNAMNINADSACDSQALLQLKQYYCDEKHCLKCAIGAKLLRSELT